MDLDIDNAHIAVFAAIGLAALLWMIHPIFVPGIGLNKTMNRRTAAILALIAGPFLVLGLILLVGSSLGLLNIYPSQETLDKTAITRAEYDSVELGVARSRVLGRFGSPLDLGSNAFTVADPVGTQCVHYNQKARPVEESSFRFCFNSRSRSLQSKSRVRLKGSPLIVFTGH